MIMPLANEPCVRSTGGQVDEMVMALIDAAYDKEDHVRENIRSALQELGKKQPALVLSSCHSFLLKHSKLSLGHRVVILNCMESIIKETLPQIDNRLAVDIIKQGSEELTHSKEVMPEWQTAASGVLVAIGAKYCNDVMEDLLQKFQPGMLPHFFVVQTMGNLASANPYDMVPFLSVVLGTMLPMLGMAKQDNMRWVFSSALGKFCEAILDYVANLEKAPDPSVKKDAYAGQIFSAYDVLFNVWLQSKEAKLRLTIVETLGQMTHIIGKEKLEEQLPKLLQGILGLYRRHGEPYHVTQGLCMVLDAATADESRILEQHLDNLLSALFPQACQPPDFNNPMTVKNHNEVLRCFTVLARSFSDKLVGFLLQKLESGNEKTKIGTMATFRHLINAADDHLGDKKLLIVSGLKMVLNEPNNKIKKVLAQTVVAMAHHGYLELEGGQLMVEFIVRNCALLPSQGKRPADPEYVSNEMLKSMCDNVLQLLTTTVEQMDEVLWPYLLEFLVPEQYTEAASALCRSIADLATKKREENAEDYDIDYETMVNIPKPPAILARCLVLSGQPQKGKNRGTNVLQMLKGLSPNINETLVALWDTVLPKLTHYLDDNIDDDEKWSQKNWEDLLLKMLSKTLDEADDEEWVCSVGEALGDQTKLYTDDKYDEERNFLYKCLGVVLRKSTKKDFVNKHLDLIFNFVKHSSKLDREGCAIAMGFAAASHLDSVIAKLEQVGRNDTGKKQSGFLGFLKENLKVDVDERSKATLMLCYGYVTLYAPTSLITSRLESSILRSINSQFQNVKDPNVKHSLIKTVELIGRALHPDHLQSTYSFTSRADLLNHMQSYMKSESLHQVSNEIRALCLHSCGTLVKLEPALSEAETFDLIKVSLDTVLPLPPGGVSTKKAKEESYDEVMEHEVLMDATLQALDGLLIEIMKKDVTCFGLENIFKHLHPWSLSMQDHERERAITLILSILNCYLNKLEITAGKEILFSILGSLLARLAPRCTDPVVTVRQMAIDCIQAVLRISERYQGQTEDQKDKMVEALSTLKDRVKKADANVLFSVVNDLSKVLAKKLPVDQVESFLEHLFDGLLDPHSQSSSGACVVLNSILKSRGGELHSQVERIIETLEEKLGDIYCPQTKTGTLRSIRTLASHHLLVALTTLLNFRLPFDENVVDCWKILAQDSHLMASITDHILDTLSRSLPFEEKPDPHDKDKIIRTATHLPLAAISALTEMMKVEETEPQVLDNFPRLLAASLVRIAATAGVKSPKSASKEEKRDSKEEKKKFTPKKQLDVKPSSLAIANLQQLLERAKCTELRELLDTENCWEQFEDEDKYPEAVSVLARGMVELMPQYIAKVVSCLNPDLSSLYDPHRIMVAAFFSELIEHKCGGDLALVEMMINNMLGRLVDTSHVVRMLCIRGLGNVACVGPEQVQRYSTTLLSAMMAGMDDKEDPDDDITLEAMSGLSKILAEIDESHIRAILINISLRIRPCFEKDKAAVRAAAFTLFGNLSRFGDGPSKAPFTEQIHTNFISLLLHLNDPEAEVRKGCKHALRLLGPFVGSETINNMFQRHLLDDASLHYGEFMNDLAKAIISDFGDKLNFYVMGNVTFFKSIWSEIKGNAAMFVGFLLGNMQKESYSLISKEHVCGALILLLKDPSADVRIKAAEAMSWLYQF